MSMKSKKKEKDYIFRATITIDGVVYKAKDYGKKAFKIKITH